MTDKRLYGLPIPNDAQTSTSGETRRNVAAQGSLSDDPSPVEAISLEPGERSLTVQYRARYAELLAESLEQLFDAGSIEEVPYYGVDRQTPQDGYYTLERSSPSQPDPRIDGVHETQGVLRKAGTRNSHWRSVASTPAQVENDFGTDTTAYIGVPATAEKIRWFNRETGGTESGSVVVTRAAEHGDVDIYDADTVSFSTPVLIYDLAYDQEGRVDPVAYDTNGNDSKTDSDGVVQWQAVFRSENEFEGDAVFDNGLLRLVFDEPGQSLSAEEWDAGNETWNAVSLGTSDWVLFDLDLTRISPARIEGQVGFENTADGSLYSLDMVLARGADAVLWMRPDNEPDPTPSGLVNKLDPIADRSIVDLQDAQTLTARGEVRK